MRTPRKMRILALLVAGALLITIAVALQPINATLYRLIFLLSAFATWLGLLVALWKRMLARVALGAFAGVFALAFLLPGRTIDRDDMRASYVEHLRSYEGTEYIWGGESGWGIDCSGLPRRALRDAQLGYGLRYLNGDATRLFAEQWWFDTSAKALGQGYREFTVNLDIRGTIAEMSYDDLLPGDLAVTDNGLHVLVYMGGESWIQADPFVGFVVTMNGRSGDNNWFQQPVTLHRWKVLAGG